LYSAIRYEVDDPVATITLSRPSAMNAWTDTMGSEILDAVGRACADPAVVGIVITGDGRAFCAGADMQLLDGLAGSDPSEAGTSAGGRGPDPSAAGDFDHRFGFMLTAEKPIIGAINGAVAGMAYPFALCCDLRVVCPEALFVTAFAQRGLIAEWGLGWLLPKLVGPAVAMDLLLSSRRVGGEEAYRLGLANYIVDRGDLLPFCRRYVEELGATCSPSSMAIMKRQVHEHYHRGLGAAETEARRLMAESFGRPDFGEGVRSFIEKRPPNFPRVST